jgi:hypothetical protein
MQNKESQTGETPVPQTTAENVGSGVGILPAHKPQQRILVVGWASCPPIPHKKKSPAFRRGILISYLKRARCWINQTYQQLRR